VLLMLREPLRLLAGLTVEAQSPSPPPRRLLRKELLGLLREVIPPVMVVVVCGMKVRSKLWDSDNLVGGW
jgi:hypothetical protein